MGIGVLGILGGVGKGIMVGQENARRQDEADQLKQLRGYQIRDAQRKAKMQDEEAAADSDTSSDANGIQAASKQAADNVNAQSSANSSLAQSYGAAIKSGVSQAMLPGANPTPTLASMASPTSTGAPNAGTVPADSTPATGIQAAADSATGAAAPNGSSNLANSQPAAASTTARPLTDQESYVKAWQQKAAKIAAIHDKYGDHAGADAILKSANDRSMAMYDMQLTNAMRDYYGGNFDSAAGKLATLYNLSQPDGSYVDVKSVGGGQFDVTHYDKDGNPGASQVIGQQDVENLAQTTLSSAERAKLLSANVVARARMYHDDKLLQVAAGHDKTKVDTTNTTEAGKTARNAASNDTKQTIASGHDSTKVNTTEMTEAGKNTRNAASNATRERDTDVMAGSKNAGKEDPNLKEAAAKVAALAKKGDLTNDPDILSKVGAMAEANVKSGMSAAAAVDKARDDFNNADAASTKEAIEATNKVKNSGLEFGTTGLEKRGDQDIVARLKAAGKLNLANYQKEYAAKARAQKLGATSAPTPAAPRGKLVTGANGQLVYQPQ